MDDKREASNIKILIIITAIFLVVLVGIVVLFFNCVHTYSEFDVDCLNFTQEKLTFHKYENRYNRASWFFDIYFKEYEQPFTVFLVTSKSVKANLDKLQENDILKVTFCKDFDDICEISCNGDMIFSLSDYIKANKNNQMMGMICCILAFLGFLCLTLLLIRALKPINDNAGLGRLRMEYVVKGNVIRIYHSVHVCSLVINDQIFDQHHGIYGSYFCLNGIIGMMKAGGKTIRVEAKMGACHMRLYCNGQLVAKKFMAFG